MQIMAEQCAECAFRKESAHNNADTRATIKRITECHGRFNCHRASLVGQEALCRGYFESNPYIKIYKDGILVNVVKIKDYEDYAPRSVTGIVFVTEEELGIPKLDWSDLNRILLPGGYVLCIPEIMARVGIGEGQNRLLYLYLQGYIHLYKRGKLRIHMYKNGKFRKRMD